MSDLIERLRQVWSNDNCTHEAADEIERLTTEVSELKGTISILTQLNEQKTDDRYDDWAFSEDGYMRRGKALRVENERLQARVEALEGAVRWALGEAGDFPMIAEPPYYRWRTELRERARMKYNADRGHSVAATEQENTCRHEWCDIATGGQYCRLCDARRPEYEGMAYDD